MNDWHQTAKICSFSIVYVLNSISLCATKSSLISFCWCDKLSFLRSMTTRPTFFRLISSSLFTPVFSVCLFSNLSLSLSLSFFFFLPLRLDAIRTAAAAWTFLTAVPVNKRMNWGPPQLGRRTAHFTKSLSPPLRGEPLPRSGGGAEKCTRARVLTHMTASLVFLDWSKRQEGRTSSLSPRLREALLQLTDSNSCPSDCKASWVGKRFRSSGSRTKGTSRWAPDHVSSLQLSFLYPSDLFLCLYF